MAIQVAFSSLNSFLQAQPENTADTPYELKITGLTEEDVDWATISDTLGDVLIRNNTKYVDLSQTELPNVTSLSRTFLNCTTLVNAPVIPNRVINLNFTFSGCISLKLAPAIPASVIYMAETFLNCKLLVTAPVLPSGVTDIMSVFSSCTSLVNAPVIPDSVTQMTYAFMSCTSLINAPIIPEGVTEMNYAFSGCTSLSHKSIIPNTVTSSSGCYMNVITSNWKGTKEQAEYFIDTLSTSTDAFELQVYENDRLTLKDTWDVVGFSNLADWLNNKPANTINTPYQLVVTGLTAEDLLPSTTVGTLGNIIKNKPQKYLDLSVTKLPIKPTYELVFAYCQNLVICPNIPNGVTGLRRTFEDCNSMINVPTIPNTVTFLDGTFNGCISIVEAPNIPESVNSLANAFKNCTSLTTITAIPDSVTNIQSAFENCTSLVTAPFIPNRTESAFYASKAFKGCTSLIKAPIMPDTNIGGLEIFYNCSSLDYKPIINSTETSNFTGVTTLNWKGSLSQVETFNPNCPDDCEIQIYNDDRITLEDTIYNIDVSTLSTYLAGLAPNTISTAYKVFVRGLTSSNITNIKTALTANSTKYVNLKYTEIPSGITQMNSTFSNCTTLVESPVLPDTVTHLFQCFSGCSSLQKAPTLPSSLLVLRQTFYGCTSLSIAPVIPNSVTDMNTAFYYCTSLTLPPVIPSNVTDMNNCFRFCVALTQAPNIPDGVTDITEAFEMCPFTEVTIIPASVTNGEDAFKNCSSLKKIDEFRIPLATLRDNSDFQNMFAGCTSLEQIGHKPDTADDFHLVYLDIGEDSVEGKIYSRDKTSVDIEELSITKSTLTLPVQTDELIFTQKSSSELEEIIEGTQQQEGILDTHYSWFGKFVIQPDGDHFLLYAKDKNKFQSNIDFGGSGSGITVYDTLQELEDDLPNHNVGDVLAVDSDYFIDKTRILDDITTLAHDEILNILKEAVSVPIGTILSIPSSSVIAGYLQCNGSTFDELDYPFLYSALRTNRLPKKWNAEEWVINQEILTEETFFGKPVYSFSFYDDRTRTNSWAVCMPNGETYFPYEHNIKRIIGVESSSSHNTTYRNGTVGTHIYQITNTVLDSTTQEYIPSATSQLYIYYGNQNYWSATDRVLRTIYYTKIEDDETRFRWKYIKAISGVEEEESATVVNAIQVAEEGLEQTVRDTADSIMAAAIDNYFKEYVLAEATVTPTSGTQAVNANTVFNDSLLNYRTVRFYMKRSTGNTDYVPHYDVTHEEMVNLCAKNTNYSLMIPGYASEYRQMTFNAGGTVCTAVAGSECCYKVIGIGKLN